MFRMLILAIASILISPVAVNAQNMWGTGMYGATQGCSTQMKVGNGATSMDDTTKEIQAAISEAQTQLKQKQSEKKKIDKMADRARANVEKTIASDYSDFIFEHIENNRRCEEYQGLAEGEGGIIAQGDQGGEPIVQGRDMLPVQGFTVNDWKQVCDRTKAGSVVSSVCANARYKEEGSRSDSQTCKKALTDYRKQYSQSQKLQREIEKLQDQIAGFKEDLAIAKQDAVDAQREARLGGTEGDYCAECMAQGNGGNTQKPQTDWANVIANIGTGLAASYVGYKTTEMVADYNSNLGYPTYPSVSSVGYPYIMAGIYGAVNGATGQGSFGCGNGVNGNMMGGAFGYPSSMMGGMGGGLYMNAGMGNMMGYGGMMGSMMGSMMGYGTMMGAYPGSMMGSMMSGMMGYGAMMGNSMMGYGSMMGNYGSMMSGMMGYGGLMGSMMGSMTGSMMGYGSMMGNMMGYGSMMSAYPGSMVSGLMGYGTMMGSMTGSMMGYGSLMGSMVGNNMLGYGTMLGSFTGSTDSLAYQQQLLQSQLAYQQQYASAALQKYQTVSSLQQEMYSLMYKIQQVQYGGTTNYISTGTLGTSTSGLLPVTGINGVTNGTTYSSSLGTIPITTTTTIPSSR